MIYFDNFLRCIFKRWKQMRENVALRGHGHNHQWLPRLKCFLWIL